MDGIILFYYNYVPSYHFLSIGLDSVYLFIMQTSLVPLRKLSFSKFWRCWRYQPIFYWYSGILELLSLSAFMLPIFWSCWHYQTIFCLYFAIVSLYFWAPDQSLRSWNCSTIGQYAADSRFVGKWEVCNDHFDHFLTKLFFINIK